MRWEGNRESSNVEDVRDGGGGGGGFGFGGRSIGIGT
ncbi:MAG TPA: metalloprotease, partial [Ramlibacter sp.]|nr:metalloprotease [Ramlibacter sp.]